eukprot:GEMP01005225.1.p1 GENE.GEMP01005225.1~~GEMP01005225.1.p1  ORF type:complete len:968 (+),score=173.66 GEMP01005225.1:40-2943(+)
MPLDYWRPLPDQVIDEVLARVCAMDSPYDDEEAFAVEWGLAMANLKRLVGWKLAMAILHRSSATFHEKVDWLLLLDTLHEMFRELSGREDTPPAAIDFFKELDRNALMVMAFKMRGDLAMDDLAMNDPAVNAVALLQKFMMLTAHVDRVPSLRESFVGILFSCFYTGDQMHDAVFDWVKEQVADENEFVREAVRDTLLRDIHHPTGENFRQYLLKYLPRTVEAKESGSIALAKFVASVNWYWGEQVVLSSVIAPIVYCKEEEKVLYGLSLLSIMSEGKQAHWQQTYVRFYDNVRRQFASSSYNVRMQCVMHANSLGLIDMLEERYKKETAIKIQLKIVDMIDQHGKLEWLYCTKKKDGKVLSHALDCVLKTFDNKYVNLMEAGLKRRDGTSAICKMLNFFLVSWQNLGTEPFRDREDDLERAISMFLGEGMSYGDVRLDLLLNLAHVSEDAKVGFRFLCRARLLAREMLLRVKNGVVNAYELRAFAPRARPEGTPTAPFSWQQDNSTLRDEYTAFTEETIGNGKKRARPCTDVKWQGLWRRFGLFVSPKLVSDMLTELIDVPQEPGRANEIFCFIASFRKMMFSLADYSLIKTWAPMILDLLERCTPNDGVRADALVHALSIFGKLPPAEPFHFLPAAKAEWFYMTYFRSHPKFVANAMNLWACGQKPLELICEPLEICKQALALAGCIQSPKLEKIADRSARYTKIVHGVKMFEHATDEDTIMALGRSGTQYIELVAELGKKECGSLAAGLSLCRAIRKNQLKVDSSSLFALLRAVLYFPDDMVNAFLHATEAHKWKFSDVMLPLAAFFALSNKHQIVTKVKLAFARYVEARDAAVRGVNLTVKLQTVAEFFAYVYSKLPPALYERGNERLFLGACECPSVRKVMEFLVKGVEWSSDMEIQMDRPSRSRNVRRYRLALVGLQDVIKRAGTNKPSAKVQPRPEERQVAPVAMLMGQDDDDDVITDHD